MITFFSCLLSLTLVQKSSLPVVLISLSSSKETMSEWGATVSESAGSPRLKELHLEELRTQNCIYIWSKEIYDSSASAKRIKIWRDLCSGALKSGDTVDLGDVFGAISNGQAMLRENYGFTEDSAAGKRGAIAIARIVTLEYPDGRQGSFMFSDRRLIDVKELTDIEWDGQKPPSKENIATNLTDRLTVEYWSMANSEDKLLASRFIFDHLGRMVKEEADLLRELRAQFIQNLSTADPKYKDGGSSLSQEEVAQLDKFLSRQGLTSRNVKIIDSMSSPAIGIKFVRRKDEHYSTFEIPMMILDQAGRSHKLIRP
ncbi:MAG: hypothetical protein ACKVQS_05290 [Fimbriimonadaceae bacterium]